MTSQQLETRRIHNQAVLDAAAAKRAAYWAEFDRKVALLPLRSAARAVIAKAKS